MGWRSYWEKTTKKQVLNKTTVHVVETEQTSLPICTEETLPEPLAPTEETLCEETCNKHTLLEPLTPTAETLQTEEPQVEENIKCPICFLYTKDT